MYLTIIEHLVDALNLLYGTHLKSAEMRTQW